MAAGSESFLGLVSYDTLFSVPVVCSCITIAFIPAVITAERLFPYTKGQPLFRKGFWTDTVAYGIVQSVVLGSLIGAFMQWVDASSGLSRVTLIRQLPLPLQLFLFFIVHDFYIYWFHRLQHYSDVLWRTHEAHHSVEAIDWMAGTRSNAVEIMINQTVEYLPILLFASPEVASMKATLDALWGMFIHSNIDVRMGALQYVFNGPEMHRWHHASDIGPPGVNFSTKIAAWDWLFGTAYLPQDKHPSGYGLGDPAYPTHGLWSYFQQHLYALRSFRSH